MKKILLFGAALILLMAGCGYVDETRVQSAYPNDDQMWESIFASEVELTEEVASEPRGVILPYDLTVANEMNAMYRELSKFVNPETVVLMGPNSSEVGDKSVQTCDSCIFETTVGEVEIDREVVDGLINEGAIVANNLVFNNEDAIYTHSAYIAKYFPNAAIVPIIFDYEMSEEEVFLFTESLSKYLDEDSFIIASVDFSHGLPPEVADFHDHSSFTTISNIDYDNVFDLEIDSHEALYAIMKLMDKDGAKHVVRHAHTNIADYYDEHKEVTTSHQFITFSEGEISPVEGVSILSVGKMPKIGSLGLETSWRWDRDYETEKDMTAAKQLRDIRGKEDRFLVGADYIVFDLLEEGCNLNEHNGMKVMMCKYAEDVERLGEILDELGEAAETEDIDLMYLLYDFGSGDLTEERKKDVRSIAKEGVDIFVGRGLSGVIPFETYRGSLLFYSLGDFIVDNSLVSDLNRESEGVVLGLYVDDENYYIYHFPIEIINGYPRLMDFSVRPASFLKFTAEADLGRDDKTDTQKGVLIIER